jgi:glycerol uptake facilitator-like aquaporin
MHLDAAVFGEFVGTMVLVLLGNGVVGGVLLNGSKAVNSGWIVITAGWAFAVFCGVATALALGDPDAHLNPAVTVASVILNGHTERLFTYIPAQLLGALLGATWVWLFYLPHFAITEVHPGAGGLGLRLTQLGGERRCGRLRPGVDRRAYLEHRLVAGRHHRIRHQPGARPGTENRPCSFTHSG